MLLFFFTQGEDTKKQFWIGHIDFYSGLLRVHDVDSHDWWLTHSEYEGLPVETDHVVDLQ